MPSPSPSNAPRFRSLDGLRGIAACLVMMSHMEWNNHLSNKQFVINGYLSVDLFFILSGLVIAANYGNKIRDLRSGSKFMGLRFFRLYPLHATVLGMFLVVECFKWAVERWTGFLPEHAPFSGGQSVVMLAANLLLIQGLGLFHQYGWNGPSWSISCEFFAYVLFALLCPFKALRRTWMAVAVAAFSACSYLFLVRMRGNLDIVSGMSPLRCIAGFSSGVLLWKYRAVLGAWPPARWNWFQLLVAAAVTAVMALARGPAVLASIPAFVLLILCVRTDEGPVSRLLTARPLQLLGRISYSIYMVHELVVICVLMLLKRHAAMVWNTVLGRQTAAVNPWLGDALLVGVIATVLVIAKVMYEAIEEPGRAFGRRALSVGSPMNPAHLSSCDAANTPVAETICRELT